MFRINWFSLHRDCLKKEREVSRQEEMASNYARGSLDWILERVSSVKGGQAFKQCTQESGGTVKKRCGCEIW